MASLNLDRWIGGVIGIIVTVLMTVTVLIPVISSNQAQSTVANADAINSMLNLIPLLTVVGIIIFVIAMFISKSKNN